MAHKSIAFLTKIKLFVLISTSLSITSISNVGFCLEADQSAAATTEAGNTAKSDEATKPNEAAKANEAAKPQVADKQKEVVVSMYDNCFCPYSVTVLAGQKIVWVNRGSHTHNVSIRGYFRSGDIPPGGSTSYVFKNDGLYDALCTKHAFMFAGMINRITVN